MNAADLLRNSLLGMAQNSRLRHAIQQAPVSSSVVKRFVAGSSVAEAVETAGDLRHTARQVTIDYLGEDTHDLGQAAATTDTYVRLLSELSGRGLSAGGRAEVSVKLSAIGLTLPKDGSTIALENIRTICSAAREAGTTVTLDMEDHTSTDATLTVLREVRVDFPETGAVLQAYLRRTEADCRDLAYAGSRVRLCKGAYMEPESVAYQGAQEVDQAYVRCLRILMEAPCYPMVASHDPRMIAIAGALAARADRAPRAYEYQMLLGVRPGEQKRIADRGDTMRVYLPFGEQWYGYLMRRMAERPANTLFFLRGLVTRN
ncbi:MAG: proline dehydrogenase family protein [Nostocoides sp.]